MARGGVGRGGAKVVEAEGQKRVEKRCGRKGKWKESGDEWAKATSKDERGAWAGGPCAEEGRAGAGGIIYRTRALVGRWVGAREDVQAAGEGFA